MSDRLHPASLSTLRQLVMLHGAGPAIAAVETIHHTAQRYRVKFVGRTTGAIGIFYPITAIYVLPEHPTRDDAIAAISGEGRYEVHHVDAIEPEHRA